MRTRIIYTKIWKDEYFANLKKIEQVFFLYLLTNERVNLCGTYELSDREIKFDLNLLDKELDELKEKFINDEKFLFKEGWVIILNYDRYNNYTGEKNLLAKERESLEIPKSIIEYQYPIDRVSDTPDTPSNIISNITSNIISKEGVVKGGVKDIYNLYLKQFNKNPTLYKLTLKRKKKISDRLKDAGEEMLQKAIINASQDKFYSGDNDRGWTADLDYITRSYENVEKLAGLLEKSKIKRDITEDEFNQDQRRKL